MTIIRVVQVKEWQLCGILIERVKQNLLNANFNDITTASSSSTTTTTINKILLTPLQTQNPNNNNNNNNNNNSLTITNRKQQFLPINTVTTTIHQTPKQHYQQIISTNTSINSNSKYNKNTYTLVDFTDAQLIIERNTEGKHSIGNIILPPTAPKPLFNTQINTLTTDTQTTGKMSFSQQNSKCPSAKDSSLTSTPSSSCSSIATNSVYMPNNLNTNTNPHRESLIKSKVKKFINKIPLTHSHNSDNSSKSKTSKSNKNNNNNAAHNVADSYQQKAQITASRTMSIDTTSSSESGITTTTTNSYDFFLMNGVPVYTEENLPPRILRKHQKKALTDKIRNDFINNNEDEALVNNNEVKELNDINVIDLAKTIQDIYQINDIIEQHDQERTPRTSLILPNHDNNYGDDDDDYHDLNDAQFDDESMHMTIIPPPPQFSTDELETPTATCKMITTTTATSNEEPNEESYMYIKSTNNSRLASATSPKAPPRTKMKYRKSKTTEFKLIKKANNDNEYEINADSLESDNDDSIASNEKKVENTYNRSISVNPTQINRSISNGNGRNFENIFNRPDLSLNYEIPTRDTTETTTTTTSPGNKDIDKKRYEFVLNYVDSGKNKYLKFFPLTDDPNNNNNNAINTSINSSSNNNFSNNNKENTELNDSLDEDDSFNKSKKSQFDDDSLLFEKETIVSRIDFNVNGEITSINNSGENSSLFKRQLSKRAQWDKSPQPLEFIYYNVYNERLKKTSEFNNNNITNTSNSQQTTQVNGFMSSARTTKPFMEPKQAATTKPVQKVIAFKHNEITTTNFSDAMVTATPVKQKPIAAVVATPKVNATTIKTTKPVTSMSTNPTPAKPTSQTPLKKSYEVLHNNEMAKRIQNIESTKQKLYEMKKNMDAKLNSNNVAPVCSRATSAVRTPAQSKQTSNKSDKLASTNTSTNMLATSNANETKTTTTATTTTTNTTRTTPRKVKKRSGERSFTTGCVMDENKINKEEESLEFKQTFGPQANATSSRTPRTSTQSIASTSTSVTRPTTKRSKSAHSVQESGTRQRRDSIVSNASSSNTFSSSGVCVEYKENKAYELRKVANLKTKIATRQIENNPVFTRANPVCTEIIEVTSDQTRKRLFAKKNEKVDKIIADDPTVVLGNILGTSTSIPLTLRTDFDFLNNTKGEKKSPKSFQQKDCSPTQSTSNTNPPKSKSASNLLEGIERTNSTLDLLELLHNQEAPKGDADQYKIMLSECEKFDKQLRHQKSIENSTRKQEHNSLLKATTASANKAVKKLTKTESQNYKRSHSLPSYNRAPVVDIVDNNNKALKNVQ